MKTAQLAAWGATIAVVASVLLSALPLADIATTRIKTQGKELRGLQAEIESLRAGQGELWQETYGIDQRVLETDDKVDVTSTRLADFKSELVAREAARTAAQEASAKAHSPAARRSALVRDILSPVFQLSGEGAVGSGVLVYKGKDEKGSYYLALSCYHVIRDILGSRSGATLRDDVEVRFDAVDGKATYATAHMIEEDLKTDLALLRIDTYLDLGQPARLAPSSRMSDIEVFSDIYTVGCPLGTAAQATRGEISRTSWDVDGVDHWMLSSPAYFGNSGGGIFLAETHELIGVFTKIYTHGSSRPQVITHMGLSVPLDTVLDWLLSKGYDFTSKQVKQIGWIAEASHQE